MTDKKTDRHFNKQTDRQKGQIKFANFNADSMKKMVHCAKQAHELKHSCMDEQINRDQNKIRRPAPFVIHVP